MKLCRACRPIEPHRRPFPGTRMSPIAFITLLSATPPLIAKTQVRPESLVNKRVSRPAPSQPCKASRRCIKPTELMPRVFSGIHLNLDCSACLRNNMSSTVPFPPTGRYVESVRESSKAARVKAGIKVSWLVLRCGFVFFQGGLFHPSNENSWV